MTSIVEEIADTVIQKYSLSHPFDIFDFASSVAEIVFTPIPFQLDAILFKRSPLYVFNKIIVNSNKPRNRRVFTVAHELGHIFIMWHVGQFRCVINGDDVEEDDDLTVQGEIDEMERQADEFASALLVPKSWVSRLITELVNPIKIFEEVKRMGISNIVACRALALHMPPNFIICISEVSNDNVIKAYNSPRTLLIRPLQNTVLDENKYDMHGAKVSSKIFEGKRITIWEIPLETIPLIEHNFRTSKNVIDLIYEDLGISIEEKRKLESSISGIIGHSLNLSVRGGQSLYSVMKIRLYNRQDLAYITNHNLFEVYMMEKAKELSIKHGLPIK